jgi:hypothetical protein
LAGETEVLGENLPQCHFIHRKSHITSSGANPGRHVGKPATNRLSYGTAFTSVFLGEVHYTVFILEVVRVGVGGLELIHSRYEVMTHDYKGCLPLHHIGLLSQIVSDQNNGIQIRQCMTLATLKPSIYSTGDRKVWSPVSAAV